MSEIRKASDILLDLERKIEELSREMKLNNQTQMLILSKMNTLINPTLPPIAGPDKIIIPGGQKIQSSNQPLDTNNNNAKRVGQDTSVPGSNKAKNADIEFTEYLSKRANQPKTDDSFKNFLKDKIIKNETSDLKMERKIPATQRVQDDTKKDLFNAEINIFIDGNFFLKTKTNALGKWQAQLPPGEYLVKVSKMDTVSQKKMEAEGKITIPPNANSTIILPTLIVNRG